jgi:hypothetical protein
MAVTYRGNCGFSLVSRGDASNPVAASLQPSARTYNLTGTSAVAGADFDAADLLPSEIQPAVIFSAGSSVIVDVAPSAAIDVGFSAVLAHNLPDACTRVQWALDIVAVGGGLLPVFDTATGQPGYISGAYRLGLRGKGGAAAGRHRRRAYIIPANTAGVGDSSIVSDMRWTFTCDASTQLRIGSLWFGAWPNEAGEAVLRMERPPLPGELAPVDSVTEVEDVTADDGRLLGRSVHRSFGRGVMRWSSLTAEFVRSKLYGQGTGELETLSVLQSRPVMFWTDWVNRSQDGVIMAISDLDVTWKQGGRLADLAIAYTRLG